MYPFTGWSSYLTGLAVGVGCLATRDEAYIFMLKAIPLDIYALVSILLVFLVSVGMVKDLGPMKIAETKAMGKDYCETDETTIGDKFSGLVKERVFLNFVLPTLILVVVSIGSFFVLGGVKVLEAVTIVVVLMSFSFLLQGMKIDVLGNVFIDGIKNAMPAVTVLSVAYPLNAITKELGAADFILGFVSNSLPHAVLPAVVFILCAVLSFSTGTSWGTFAIAMPIVLPMAFGISGGEDSLFTLLCFSAVAGGGLFGDHCSPVSDTTIMSSMGADVEHIEHVKTQMPYALLAAMLTLMFYIVMGLFAI